MEDYSRDFDRAPIAERHFDLADRDPVVMRLFPPFTESDGSCRCSYEIAWSDGVRRFRAYGVDTVQALRLAMRMIEAELLSSEEARSGRLTLYGDPNLGLSIEEHTQPDYRKLSHAAPFLTFEGQAAEAMAFYVSLFEDNEILVDIRYGAEGPGRIDAVMKGVFRIAGLTVMCADSVEKHDFSFTPATSLFIECASIGDFDHLASALSEGGSTLMAPGDYGFSRCFAWVKDRYGVSWQLNLT